MPVLRVNETPNPLNVMRSYKGKVYSAKQVRNQENVPAYEVNAPGVESTGAGLSFPSATWYALPLADRPSE